MSGTGEDGSQALAALRARIDAIDGEIHGLLMQRGAVIDSLIKIKGTSRPGAAFRPGREADMMRRLVDRHGGALGYHAGLRGVHSRGQPAMPRAILAATAMIVSVGL